MACLGLSVYLANRNDGTLSGDERRAFQIAGLVVNPLALWALSLEAWDLFDRMQPEVGIDAALAQQLALSLLWALYATALILVGVRQKSASLRWQGLALFGVVVGKVFFYDMASLERAYRIISFMVLGIVLLMVSFLYQKRMTDQAPKSNP